VDSLARFERIVRAAPSPQPSPGVADAVESHPFETRNIHPDLPPRVRSLFDDGYYPEATFLAYKFIETEVKRLASIRGQTGFALMMTAFDETKPKIALNNLGKDSDIDEQRGYRHMFAGAQSAIRNPRGHDTELVDNPDLCLDHLALASVLLRRLDDAGLRS
jgi:uncharacterized protein (TIGR02391 family)